MTLNLHIPTKRSREFPAIKAFIQTSFLDWRGLICSVVFLGHCNFRCPYCHNKDLVLWPHKLSPFPLQDVRDCISSHADWLDGIVISGGEPCLNPGLPQSDYARKRLTPSLRCSPSPIVHNIRPLFGPAGDTALNLLYCEPPG